MSKTDTGQIPQIVRNILSLRGIRDEEDIAEFLSPSPQLTYDPFLLSDMEAGVDLLLKAIDQGKKIVIYGDYDTDGVTSTALLMTVLGTLTDNLTYYIPMREEEGYGLNKAAVDKIKADGGQLILTVDCGIVSKEETHYAHQLGIDTIVTDHHIEGGQIAEGIVIDPKRKGDKYPFKGLAGVGVAYKFACAVSRKRSIPKKVITEVLELAAVGTVADIMPLLDENRTIVKYGLRLIHCGGTNVGLRKLVEMSGLRMEELTSTDISFGIAPRINAAGRLGDAKPGVKMLLARTESEAARYASVLVDANVRRRSLQDEAYDQCILKAQEQLKDRDFLVVEAVGCHEGILGIVAGKIKEQLKRPVIIISREGDSFRGTGRSVTKVDLYSMLSKYAELFTKFGGHSAACGFTIPAENVETLRNGLASDIAEMKDADPDLFVEPYEADADISPEDADNGLIEALDLLEPCGKDNEKPVFRFPGVRIEGWRFLKGGMKHARFRITGRGSSLDCILFNEAEKFAEFAESDGRVDVLGELEMNTWNGQSTPQLIAREIRISEE